MEQEHFRGPDDITQAGEVEHELNIAQGKTIYLPTRPDSTLFRKVGIFIPSSFQPSAAVDLIVYFHGHIISGCKTCPSEFSKKGIEYYWNTPLFKCLREDLVASSQNAILIAPTFRPIFASKNNSPRDYGSLNEAGRFDTLVNDTLTHLQKKGELPVNTQVRNIILSGHSGGGLPMKAILNARNAMKKNIAECWGFECLYFGTSVWESWLKANPNCHFHHFRRETKFIAQTNALNKYANSGQFVDVKYGTSHCSIVKEKWRQAIDGSSVLQGGGKPREFSVINREVSDLTSLLSGLPGLATLPFSFLTALMRGFQDENHLTNLIFFARHPELGGRKLTASDPQSLKDEWMSILKTVVRPAIRRMREAGAKSSAGSVPRMIPAKSISPVIDITEDSKFYLTELKLYDKKIEVASAGDKKKGMAVIIEEAPSIFLPKIIVMARDIALKEQKDSLVEKLDPTTWFKKFTRINFLGRSLHKDQYLHLEMAKLLKVIENELVKKYGGDAKSVGNMLLNNSNEGIAGSRLTSKTAIFSMHMFGLAVDVNYSGNPYIQSPNDIRALNTVLKNAALLMNEPVLVYDKNYFKKHGPESNFDTVQQIDAMLEKYFSLLDMPERLSSYLKASYSSSEWHGLSAADARTRIQKNLNNLAGFLSRNKNYFKKHGILDFDKRFVLQMTEQRRLDWGASYGDMMHFDMRSSGVGKYINLARLDYAGKVRDLAKRLFKEKRYGTHSP